MKNYSALWKKEINLRQISYKEFIDVSFSKAFFIEKVDGMLGTLIYEEGTGTFFQTTGGTIINDIPAMYEYEVLFRKSGVKDAKIPGELVAQIGGKILPFNESVSVIKRHYIPKNKELIFHYPVDVYFLNGKKLSIKDSLSFLTRNVRNIGLPHIRLPKIVYGNINDFRQLYEDVKGKAGFDGVVARDIQGKNFKIKFTETVDLLIIGAGKVGLPAWEKEQISYLLTSFIDKNNLYRTSSRIGTGFSRVQRSNLFKFVRDNVLYDNNGEFFILPKMVVEITFFRYRLTNTPTYKFDDNRYIERGNNLSVTFSHPSFNRIRPDKKANKFDVRLEQLPEWKY